MLQNEYVFNFCLIVYYLTTWDISWTLFKQKKINSENKKKKVYWQDDVPAILILSWMNDRILIDSCKLFLLSPLYHWLVSSSWCTENKLYLDEYCPERLQSPASTSYEEFTKESLKKWLKFEKECWECLSIDN